MFSLTGEVIFFGTNICSSSMMNVLNLCNEMAMIVMIISSFLRIPDREYYRHIDNNTNEHFN